MKDLSRLKEKSNNARISGRPLLLDGAVGSLLINRLGVPKSRVWASEFNDSNPEEVIRLHRDYIEAGADIITTNTFRTNPAAREQGSDISATVNKIKSGVLLAKEAAGNKEVLIAGSNAPAEDCYQIERTLTSAQLEKNHQLHISKLIESGADFILNETQGHFDEIKIITGFCSREYIPYAVSLFCTEDLNLLSGEPVQEAIDYLNDYSPLFVSFNCITFKHLSRLIADCKLPESWGCYLNCGSGKVTDIILKCGIAPEDYSRQIKSVLKYKPSVVGACCGSGPSHIKALKEMLENNH